MAVARNGSFTKAARLLHVSQPAVTIAVRNLEQIVGVRLLDRNTRQLSLTAQGSQLLPIAERLLSDLSSALRGLSLGRNNNPRRIRIASVQSVASQLLPAAVSEFLITHADAQIVLRDMSSRHTWRQVKLDYADFGFAAKGDSEPGLEFATLFEDRMVVVAREDNDLIRAGRPVEWRQLASFDYVRLLGDTTAALVDQVNGLPSNLRTPSHELSHRMLIWAILGESARRVSVMPALLAIDCNPSLRFLPLVNPIRWRRVYAVTPEWRGLPEASLELIAQVHESAARLAQRDLSKYLMKAG